MYRNLTDRQGGGGYWDSARLLGELIMIVMTKKRGTIRGNQFHGNREIVVGGTVGVVTAHGQFTQGAIVRNPRTTYKCSKNVFTVTSIELIINRY